MSNARIEYKNYTLFCSGVLMADGRFGAEVKIVDREGATDRAETFAALEFFPTEDAAIAYAGHWGRRWVDEDGRIDPASAPPDTPLANPRFDPTTDPTSDPRSPTPLTAR